MRITFLGTGTSSGIPVICCDCPVCGSKDPRNRRRRTSLFVQAGGASLVFDTPPDFREQALAHRVPRVDAVFFTHSHADHIFGFDDLRRYNTVQDAVIPAYALAATLDDLRRVFNYVQLEKVPGLYRPRIDFRELCGGPVRVGDAAIEPFSVEHGPRPTCGFRVRADGASVGYFPDCHRMSDEVVEALRGVDVMILDALRHRPHATHLTVEESVRLLRRIGAPRSYLIHLCHDLDHEATRASLPPGVEVSWDGLVIDAP